MNPSRVFVVITAAGQSRRMGGTDKLTLPIQGRPLLAHTAMAFLSWPKLAALAVSVSPGRESELEQVIRSCCPHGDKLHLVAGGRERQDSVRMALQLLQDRLQPDPSDPVLIHDGARPFVDVALFQALLARLETTSAAIPATPVRDTVKRVQGTTVVGTEDRESLRLVQTPQAFRFGRILELHQRAREEGYVGTDDASLVERYGGSVSWISGPAHNLKVTVPEDIILLEELARRENERTESLA